MAKQKIDRYIQQWLAGEDQAFDVILNFYYPRLLSASLKIISNREDAEELVMNALLKIWQNKYRLSEIRQFDDYLFGILRREIIGQSRKRIIVMETLEDQPLINLGTVDHPELNQQEIIKRYNAALNKLSPKQRQVFLAIREEGLSRKEIVEQTSMSIHTVNSHMNTALKILRDEMKELPEVLVGLLVSGSIFL